MDLSSFKKPPKTLVFEDLVVFENENYLVINKPAFVPSINERTADRSLSILSVAKEHRGDVQVCHRLDKETSGALLIAKHPEAYRHASLQFEHRQVEKSYHAVVNGVHDLDSISVFLPIATVKDGTSVRIDKQKGKLAETIFFTLKKYNKHTLVKCMPITGRMHQIRVHLQCIKAPIVCDPTYGGEEIYLSDIKRKFNLKQDTEELPLIKRVALHARQLFFKDLNDEALEIDVPYAKDFEVLIDKLERYS